MNAVVFIRAEAGLWLESSHMPLVRFVRETLNPEHLRYLQFEIPAYIFSDTFGTAYQAGRRTGLMGDKNHRFEMLNVRLGHRQIDDSDSPGTGPSGSRRETIAGIRLKAVCSIVNDHICSIMPNTAVVETKLIAF